MQLVVSRSWKTVACVSSLPELGDGATRLSQIFSALGKAKVLRTDLHRRGEVPELDGQPAAAEPRLSKVECKKIGPMCGYAWCEARALRYARDLFCHRPQLPMPRQEKAQKNSSLQSPQARERCSGAWRTPAFADNKMFCAQCHAHCNNREKARGARPLP